MGLHRLPTAGAYIPPYWYALKSIAQNHKGLKTLTLKSTITDGSDTYNLTTHYDGAQGPAKIMIYSFSGSPLGSVQIHHENKFLSQLLIQDNLQKLIDASNKFGIKVELPTPNQNVNHEKSKLVRRSGRIGYLYGSQGKTQIVLEKDSFTLLAIDYPDYTVDFLNPKLTRFIVLPRKITLTERGESNPKIIEEIHEVSLNSSLDSKESMMELSTDIPELVKKTIQWLR
jgi:hypothetical protein